MKWLAEKKSKNIMQQSELPIPAAEKIPEINKNRTGKILLGIAVILGIVIILFYIFNFQISLPFLQNHKYKISLTHNGKPITFDSTESVYTNIKYAMDLYDETSYCTNKIIETNETTTSEYIFTNISKPDEKKGLWF